MTIGELRDKLAEISDETELDAEVWFNINNLKHIRSESCKVQKNCI